jgi:predicted TIM-barrel fold metal-dependent hydrolase
MLELEHEFRIVDVHARLAPEEQASIGGRAVSPAQLEREMHQAGIVRSVVFPYATTGTDYVAANNGVARLSVDRPFVAFARINGSQTGGSLPTDRLRNAVSRDKQHHTTARDITQYAYDDRFHGFVLDPATNGYPAEPVLEALEDVSLPVIVSGGTDAPPETLAETLLGRSFPVIVAHFGGYPLDRTATESMIDLLDAYDECYLDTSFVRYRNQLERALLEHPDRVLFGSGAPAAHPNVAVMEILTLDVSEDKLWRAFSKNVDRLAENAAGPNWV